MKKSIMAALGISLLALAVISSIGVNGLVTAQSQNNGNQQSSQQQQNASQQTGNITGQQLSNTTTARVEEANVTSITEQLHRDLDIAINAAQQNNTETVLMTLSQIMRELAQINDPAAHDITMTAGGANATSTTGNNQTGTAGGNNNNNTAGGGGTATTTDSTTSRAVTGGKSGDVDDIGSSEPETVPSDFPEE